MPSAYQIRPGGASLDGWWTDFKNKGAGQLATVLLEKTAGIDVQIVPYKGSAPAYQDLLGGQIQGFVDPLLGALSHHKASRVRVLAVTSRERVPSPSPPQAQWAERR